MSSSRKKTILLIDSHPGTLDAMRLFLHEDLGYDVITAENPLDAYDIFKASTHIDMVITDLHRENKNLQASEKDHGILLCQRIRDYEKKQAHGKKPNHVPFIVQTQWPMSSVEQDLLEGQLRQADKNAGKCLLIPNKNLEVLEKEVERMFGGREK
jgi:CheY-like chemotaxis protein